MSSGSFKNVIFYIYIYIYIYINGFGIKWLTMLWFYGISTKVQIKYPFMVILLDRFILFWPCRRKVKQKKLEFSVCDPKISQSGAPVPKSGCVENNFLRITLPPSLTDYLLRMSQNRRSPLIWQLFITGTSAMLIIWSSSSKKCIDWARYQINLVLIVIISASRTCNLFFSSMSQ